LENDGDAPLILIEIQYGARLDEADIERLADDYARA
jgi:mannose-6-phosphate isomerase-like protein (cupin superfamily)